MGIKAIIVSLIIEPEGMEMKKQEEPEMTADKSPKKAPEEMQK